MISHTHKITRSNAVHSVLFNACYSWFTYAKSQPTWNVPKIGFYGVRSQLHCASWAKLVLRDIWKIKEKISVKQWIFIYFSWVAPNNNKNNKQTWNELQSCLTKSASLSNVTFDVCSSVHECIVAKAIVIIVGTCAWVVFYVHVSNRTRTKKKNRPFHIWIQCCWLLLHHFC